MSLRHLIAAVSTVAPSVVTLAVLPAAPAAAAPDLPTMDVFIVPLAGNVGFRICGSGKATIPGQWQMDMRGKHADTNPIPFGYFQGGFGAVFNPPCTDVYKDASRTGSLEVYVTYVAFGEDISSSVQGAAVWIAGFPDETITRHQ